MSRARGFCRRRYQVYIYIYIVDDKYLIGLINDNIIHIDLDAQKYGFNVTHATLLKKEDELMRDDLVWESLTKGLKLDPKNTLITATVGRSNAEDIKHGNVSNVLSSWMSGWGYCW